MDRLFSIIAQRLDATLLRYGPLSGGDISNAYLVETTRQRLVVKTKASAHAADMFQKEGVGLKAIEATQTIAVPEVHLWGQEEGTAFFVMDYIATKRPNAKDFERLGQDLAKLHAVTNEQFGWLEDNYIGSLPQSNNRQEDWASFYVTERLLPQLQLALQRQLLTEKEIPTQEILLKRAAAIFNDSPPALLHGDLWSGNFLIATDGTPYLIDPATYYGHAEVDIAMSRLFGGFGASFYQSYHALRPIQKGMEARQDWYQLYYLLVHLNLFGASYYGSVKRMLDVYF